MLTSPVGRPWYPSPKTILLLKAPLLQASFPRRSNTGDARVILADTWFISPSHSSYLELGSYAREWSFHALARITPF